MNRKLVRLAAIAAAAAAIAAPLAHAESFNGAVRARAFEAAERGPEALRAFISRTRMIHALNYSDYASRIPASAVEADAGEGFELLPAPSEPDSATSPEQRAADELREQILRDLSHE
jgi:hypothetical protein